MSSTSKNSSLAAAKSAKADEFYTQLGDIERELRHYKKHFKGKTVYLNCDDPRVSNFFHYFSYNFETLGLKKLIAACYKSQQIDLFSENKAEQAIYLVYEGDKNGSGMPELEEIGVEHFEGDGDFRSAESIELLKEADIVVSNPPFSLFREYVAQLMEHDKKFIILGNQNTLTTKDIFELVRADKLWLGYNNGDMSFKVPAHYPPRDTRFWIDEDGQKWRSFGTMCWLTNLDIAKRHEDLLVWKSYDPELYSSYDNFDGIDVGKTADIPADYDGVMGVPVGFLTKHNPDQFEIVGITKTWAKLATKKYPTQVQVSATGRRTEVGKLNDGAVLEVDTPPARKTHYIVNGKTYIQTYPRILIRRRSEGAS